MKEEIEKIIIKFLTNETNEEELKKLTDWLRVKENSHFFNHYIRINYALDTNMNEFDSKGVKKALSEKIKKDKSIFYKLKVYKVLKYAAAVVLFFGLGYFFQQESTSMIVNTDIIVPGTNKATLTLGNGSQIALEKGESFQTRNANSNGEEIIYQAEKQKTREIIYNYLTIPRGGQFFVKLADDTKVWLNSESKLKYPVSFKKGEIREVELIYGEAYFDVSSSLNHQGSKFNIITQNQEVTVLGTELNIRAYQEEEEIKTTLVEGAVRIKSGGLIENLLPGLQVIVSKKTKTITTQKINVLEETSWKDGVFIFTDRSLKEMMTTFSRWYDIDVEFLNNSTKEMLFSGVLKRDENIKTLLSKMEKTGSVKFKITKKKLIVE